ncbi:MAG: hypothetical protein CMQ51_00915 [Gammaproteobacteria bacterium]|nr:hypothetical protein [Gammaproteobacteria bacterium]PPR66309.1 MAG: hypothetical protein CFH08_00023 [Alphaproteobacteria bacterium MarineAlpha3_Bin7]|tara:strand:- start:5821 stop:7119 length:1299 start_codon:yes stop_codon:yes gene_type:complete
MMQTGLDLAESKPVTKAVPWRYQYSDKSLVEEVHDTRYIYGNWDHLFGCWKQETNSKQPTEIIPHWLLIDENGVWVQSDEAFQLKFPKIGARQSTKWKHQERAAFIAYISSIPRSIRSLVAPFGQYSWILLDMIWQMPKFKKFLDQEIRINHGQYIVAVLALAKVRDITRGARRQIALDIMQTKRKLVIDSLVTSSKTSMFIKFLPKFGSNYYEPQVYEDVLNALVRPGIVRAISELQGGKPEILSVLMCLPEEFMVPAVVRMINSEKWGYYASLRNLVALMRLTPKSIQTRVFDALRSIRTSEEAQTMVSRWEQALIEKIHFPKPPLKAHRQLKPITSAAEMKKEGREMNNCLADLVTEVITKNKYYYRWEGPERATVCVMMVGFGENRHLTSNTAGDWIFSHAAGVKNAELSNQLIEYLAGLVKRLNFRC